MISIDNPILRLDIATILFVDMKVWNGTDGIDEMLRDDLKEI